LKGITKIFSTYTKIEGYKYKAEALLEGLEAINLTK
jgi:hypothetical protein